MKKGTRKKSKSELPKLRCLSPKLDETTRQLDGLVSNDSLYKVIRNRSDGMGRHHATAVARTKSILTANDIRSLIDKFATLPDWYVPFGLLRFFDVAKNRNALQLTMGVVVQPGSPEAMLKEFKEKLQMIADLFLSCSIVEDSPLHGVFRHRIVVSNKTIVAWSIPGEQAKNTAIIWHSVQPTKRKIFQRAAELNDCIFTSYGIYLHGIFQPMQSVASAFSFLGLPENYLELHFSGHREGVSAMTTEYILRKVNAKGKLETHKKLKQVYAEHLSSQKVREELNDSQSSIRVYGQSKNIQSSRSTEADAAIRKAIKAFRRKQRRKSIRGF